MPSRRNYWRLNHKREDDERRWERRWMKQPVVRFFLRLDWVEMVLGVVTIAYGLACLVILARMIEVYNSTSSVG